MLKTVVRTSFAATIFLIGFISLFACGAGPSQGSTPTSPIPQSTTEATTTGVPPTAAVQSGTAVAGSPIVLVPGTVPTGTPIPALTPAAIPTVPGTVRTITLADNGTSIAVPWGKRFLLALDPSWEWTVTVANPNVVARVEDVPGTQGVYEARTPEHTKITAVGDLPCHKSQPPCLAPSRTFEVEIVVEYAK